MKIIHIPDESYLDKAASEFVSLMGNKRIFAFYGELGAGKTTFIKAISKELKVQENVSSPTFALINEYNSEKRGTIYHFDLYRLENITELYDLGYEDYFYSNALCFIEWPELAENLIPEGSVEVSIIRNADNSRTVEVRS